MSVIVYANMWHFLPFLSDTRWTNPCVCRNFMKLSYAVNSMYNGLSPFSTTWSIGRHRIRIRIKIPTHIHTYADGKQTKNIHINTSTCIQRQAAPYKELPAFTTNTSAHVGIVPWMPLVPIVPPSLVDGVVVALRRVDTTPVYPQYIARSEMIVM